MRGRAPAHGPSSGSKACHGPAESEVRPPHTPALVSYERVPRVSSVVRDPLARGVSELSASRTAFRYECGVAR